MPTSYPLDPMPGRMQKTNLNDFNLVESLELYEIFNRDNSIFKGQVYQSFWRGSIPTSSSIYFYQSFVPNVTIRGLTFNKIIESQILEIFVYVDSTPGATLETINGNNLDRRRKSTGVDWLSLNPILRVDGLTDGELIDRWFEDTGGSGSKQSAAPISQLGTIGLYDSDNPRAYRIQNTSGTTAAELSISWTWNEIPNSLITEL